MVALGPSGARGVLALISHVLLYKYIYFQHKCISLFGYIYVVLPEGDIPLLNPLPGGIRPDICEIGGRPCRSGFRAFSLPNRSESRTSKKTAKKTKNQGFWLRETSPKIL